MTKIALVGFGGIGIEAAKIIVQDPSLTCDIIAYDRKEAIEQIPGPQAGVYEEIIDAIGIMGTGHTLKLTSNLDDIAGADVIIFTAGLPRKDGQSRADLISVNADTVGPVAEKIGKVAPNSFFIMVTNPLDAMVELAFRKSGIPANRMVGQAGVLDTGRLVIECANAAKTVCSNVSALVLGGHGPQMVPVYSQTKIATKPLSSYVSAEEIANISKRVADRGGTIIKRQGRSAVFSTALAAVKMAKSYILDQRLLLPTAARLQGEYGIKDLYVGVLAEISRNGARVVEVPLTPEEREWFDKSVAETRAIVGDLKI